MHTFAHNHPIASGSHMFIWYSCSVTLGGQQKFSKNVYSITLNPVMRTGDADLLKSYLWWHFRNLYFLNWRNLQT